MGMELMSYAAFRNSITEAEEYLKKELGCEWSLTEELGRPDAESKIQLAKFSQPVCTVLQIALVDLLRTWNIEPVAVAGHLSGEIGAAYCLGAITKQTAWKVSYIRGHLCSGLKSKAPELHGSMMAVGLGSDEVKPYISTISAGRLTIACVNSPSSVHCLWDEAGIDELLGRLKVDSVFARKLKVENALPLSSHESYCPRIFGGNLRH
jgi:acyl transferase domain-containing protein